MTALCVQAFDNSATFTGAIKLLEKFEGLLERAAVIPVVRACVAVLMPNLALDIRQVRACFPIASPSLCLSARRRRKFAVFLAVVKACLFESPMLLDASQAEHECCLYQMRVSCGARYAGGTHFLF